MGTAIIKINLAEEFANLDQYLLFLVLLDFQKVYNNLGRGRLLQTLEGYRAGPRMQGIPVKFWARQEVVTRQNGYHDPQFAEPPRRD